MFHKTESHLTALISFSFPFFKTTCSSSPPSCWLSLEGGLLYAFVGPAAVIVLVGFHGPLSLSLGPSDCQHTLVSQGEPSQPTDVTH